MNSEKVKEIKYYLEQSACMYGNMQKQALTLINELESENENFKGFMERNDWESIEDMETTLDKAQQKCFEVAKENQQLKDRIAELEKDTELLRNAKVVYETVDYSYEDLKKAEKRIAELEEYIKGNEQDAKAFVNGWHKDLETELKQFAERLKAKMPCEEVFGGVWHKIDETLKEFINKGDN